MTNEPLEMICLCTCGKCGSYHGSWEACPPTEKFQRLVEAARTARGQDILSAERELRDACSPERVSDLLTHVAALTSEVRALTAAAARYRFLKPHLMLDGEVDDADYATTLHSHLTFREECVPMPDGFWLGGVDEALDKAIDAARLASPSPTGAP